MKTKQKLLKWEIVLMMTAFLVAPGMILATPKQPKHVIGMEKAKVIALKKAPGSITDGEMEFEKKQWVYSFDIKGDDQKIHEVLVNAQSGKIVSATIESPAKEAKELQQDHPVITATVTGQKK